MKKHTENAQSVAEVLEKHPKVASVTYPGLPSHPMHQVAKEQMSGFSGMISFELNGGISAGKTLMNSVQLAQLAESLGSVETLITHPATMTHAEVPKEERMARGLTDGLVRISVGIENAEDGRRKQEEERKGKGGGLRMFSWRTTPVGRRAEDRLLLLP